MAKVIIFGLMDLAELAHYYLTEDSEHEVVAFTVHKKYRTVENFKGLPVVDFETIKEKFPNTVYHLFAPMIGTNMNRLREEIYNEGNQKGYKFISYISSKATVFNNKIGDNCFILEDNTIQPFTSIGNNVILWSGNHIGHHSEIKDHVFFTSHVVMSGHCIIEPNCFLGVNSTLRDGCHVAKGTLLAMGASLTKLETEEWGIYMGNPAKIVEGKKSFEVF
ncbi:MAG: sugar O-acyltransferase [Aequorivita sp.]|nr:sugar O-acyltransferase [Aequorivita sp.]MBP42092.1 sugar O-acyltransferase [Aequorivita sp.]HBC05142.1 sugar O-acyltransferase [Aequorivita sp.]|tara:strand:+ start:9722 stop:10381 length:660 start_codon:yes stop_codon:yes gene_type:complete